MSTIDRSLIIRGPAILQWKGCNLYTKDSIELKGLIDTFEVETSLHGKVDERARSRKVEVTLTPSGMIDPISLAALFPYGSLPVGSSIFAPSTDPAHDNPLVILTSVGKKITLYAAAITQMPTLTLAASKTALGRMTFTALRKNATDSTDPLSLYQVETWAWNDPGTFDRSKVRTGPYLGDWAEAGPWHDFESLDGWQVEFDLALTPIETDSAGLIDMILAGLAVTARCRPLPMLGGVGEQELLASLPLQGVNAATSASLSGLSSTHDLVIRHGVTPHQFALTLSQAALKEGGLRFGRDDFRNDLCAWVATRAGTAPLFSLTIS